MISIWLCPDYNNELYLQNVINCLSDIHNSPRFSPHCTLVSGIKSNKHELENIIDNSIDNIGPIIVKSKRISYKNFLWKTVFIELVVSKDLKSLQNSIYTEIKSNIDYKFDPHISLIYKLMPNDIKKEIINSLHLKNSFKMDKIVAVKTGQNILDWKIIVEREFYA